MTKSCREKLWKAADQLELSPFLNNATNVSLVSERKLYSPLSFRIRMGGVKSPDLLLFDEEPEVGSGGLLPAPGGLRSNGRHEFSREVKRWVRNLRPEERREKIFILWRLR
jgi:hypothetical protein